MGSISIPWPPPRISWSVRSLLNNLWDELILWKKMKKGSLSQKSRELLRWSRGKKEKELTVFVLSTFIYLFIYIVLLFSFPLFYIYNTVFIVKKKKYCFWILLQQWSLNYCKLQGRVVWKVNGARWFLFPA